MKLTLANLLALKPGQAIPDPQVCGTGHFLRYRAKSGGVYAEFRWRNLPGVKPAWLSKSLGKLPTAAELDEQVAARRQSDHRMTAFHARKGRTYQPAWDSLDQMLGAVRGEAHELKRRLRGGRDLRAITLRGALDLHLAGKRHGERTEREYRDKLRLHFPDWADRPLASISRREVLERHKRVTEESGPYASNAAMRMFRAAWNRAMKLDETLPVCPTIAIDFNKEQRRDAAIPLALLPQWWRDINALADPVRRDFYRIGLFTGLRRRNLEEMRREHVDLEARTLHVPKPKGGKPFTLPLSSYLLELISERLARNGDSPWLFPNGASGSGHLTEPRARGTYKGVPFIIHALRNTYVSAATAAGVHPYHLKLLVNHSVPAGDVTGGYVTSNVDSLREPQHRVTDWLSQAVQRS